MPKSVALDIRATILQVLEQQIPKDGRIDFSLQQNGVLVEVLNRLSEVRNPELELAILTQWHDLYRTGYLSWGFDIRHPNPPHFYPTERGRRALAQLSRDPGNPDGYLKHLSANAVLNPIADSYLREGLACFVADLHKAAAVMIGAAAESLILGLRDAVESKLTTLVQPVPRPLTDWRIKTVTDGLQAFLATKSSQLPVDLREQFEAYWAAFAQQIRAVRNDSGHPTSVAPVTPDTVHASFLIFPELARLTTRLNQWISNDLK